ncbi:hypothetical protein DP116_19495 [Brasilonema bromeliae SPC951]|uniref:GUN4-like domain-containing protein n=2 Tax=Bromeliae group (in: Brasilonema) TaxID=3398495 RepID=A0ABX1PB33_9CYAN|nr:hypothetical protein [Brasilonema bromeliae SPC951]
MRQEIEELPDISTLPPEKQSEQNDLPSEKGVDYTRLRDLLAGGKWKEANQETLAVMLKASGREKDRYLDVESIENFPCTDLRTIDQLWVKYSNERFGFSVQKRIWKSVGGKPDANYETWEKFGDRVGWRKGMFTKQWQDYEKLTFSTNAPWGHLPFTPCDWVGAVREFEISRGGMRVLFSRVTTCSIEVKYYFSNLNLGIESPNLTP